MAVLSPQTVSNNGLNPTFAAASAGGDKIAADSRTFLVVKNGGGSSITVTVVTPATVSGLAVADLAVTVPNAGERWIGPFAPGAFADANGQASITYSAVTSVTVGAFRAG